MPRGAGGADGPGFTAHDTDLACDDQFLHCAAEVSIEFRNCSAETVELRAIEARDPGGGTTRFTPAPEPLPLAPGEAYRRPLARGVAGPVTLAAEVRTPDGFPVRVPEATVTVRDPARDAARAACDACGGLWGTWGLAGFEGCNCRTADAGRPCRDGDGCEGTCLCDGSEEVSPGLGVLVGHCSEHRLTFGCHPEVPREDARLVPAPPPWRCPTVCTDGSAASALGGAARSFRAAWPRTAGGGTWSTSRRRHRRAGFAAGFAGVQVRSRTSRR